jgi:hypothetical protein
MKEEFPSQLPPIDSGDNKAERNRREHIDAAALADFEKESAFSIVENYNKKDHIDSPLLDYIKKNHESLDPTVQENVTLYKKILGQEE